MYRNLFLKCNQPVRWLWIVLLTTIFSTKTSAVSLVWSDESNRQLYRIDTERKVLEQEMPSGNWQRIGAVTLQGIDEEDFPPTTRVTGFNKNRDQRYLMIDCTGQVYQFDFKSFTLKRLDHTFFRGYNCHSTPFIRKDTLYSLGGYGFWKTNNLMTYYKTDKGEWESITPKSSGPPSLYSGLNGYIPETDAFFSTLNFRHNDAEQSGATTFDFGVYKFSFKNQQWQQLGMVSEEVRQLLPEKLDNGVAFFFSGRYFIISYHASPVSKLLLVDPIHNQFRTWEDTHRIFLRQPANTDSDFYQYFLRNDTLHYYLFNGNELNPKGLQQKIAVSQLWKAATPIGPFYSEKSVKQNIIYLLLGVMGIGFVITFVIHRKNKKTVAILPAFTDAINLTHQEQEFFERLLQSTPTGGLSAEQVNEILQISDKTIDNQRRIRSEVIQSLNLKFKLALKIDHAIERIPSSIDRRMTLYILNEEIAAKYATSTQLRSS
jgi:hypothetical protein